MRAADFFQLEERVEVLPGGARGGVKRWMM